MDDVPKDNTTVVMLILGRVATMPISPSPLKKVHWKADLKVKCYYSEEYLA